MEQRDTQEGKLLEGKLLRDLEKKYGEPFYSIDEVPLAGFLYPFGAIGKLIRKRYGRKPFTGNVAVNAFDWFQGEPYSPSQDSIVRFFIQEGSTVLEEVFNPSQIFYRTEIQENKKGSKKYKTFKVEEYYKNGKVKKRYTGECSSEESFIYRGNYQTLAGENAYFIEEYTHYGELNKEYFMTEINSLYNGYLRATGEAYTGFTKWEIPERNEYGIIEYKDGKLIEKSGQKKVGRKKF